MCVSLPPRNLNLGPCPHTPQKLIYVEWPLYQGCVVVKIVAVGVVESINFLFFWEKKSIDRLIICLIFITLFIREVTLHQWKYFWTT